MTTNRPVKVKCWRKFLEFSGCIYQGIEASHEKWKCQGCIRSIIFRSSKKDIPFFHIHTNLKTMNVSHLDFFDWVKENC